MTTVIITLTITPIGIFFFFLNLVLASASLMVMARKRSVENLLLKDIVIGVIDLDIELREVRLLNHGILGGIPVAFQGYL
jgi:hypothetical protein